MTHVITACLFKTPRDFFIRRQTKASNCLSRGEKSVVGLSYWINSRGKKANPVENSCNQRGKNELKWWYVTERFKVPTGDSKRKIVYQKRHLRLFYTNTLSVSFQMLVSSDVSVKKFNSGSRKKVFTYKCSVFLVLFWPERECQGFIIDFIRVIRKLEARWAIMQMWIADETSHNSK